MEYIYASRFCLWGQFLGGGGYDNGLERASIFFSNTTISGCHAMTCLDPSLVQGMVLGEHSEMFVSGIFSC